MRLRTGRVPTYLLVIICIISVVFMIIELNMETRVFASFYKEKVEAAVLTQRLFETVKEKRIADGFVIDPVNDPNGTGLVGLQNSLITTEPGDLIAKLTTINPNFSAVVVQLLRELTVKDGDVVALSFSGSFPALNIAVIAACEVLKLKPILITSCGASMWGANDPEFVYLDMERWLFDQGQITTRTIAASLGGVEDIGRGLSPEGRILIAKAIERNRIEIIESDNIEKAIERRKALYEKYARERPIRAFLNVGGSAVALAGVEVPSGIVDRVKYSSTKGLVGEFLRQNIPVINLDDIYRLARTHELPVAPIPLPRSGRGKIFYESRYSIVWAVIFGAILIFIVFVVLRIDVDHYLKRTGAGEIMPKT